jgi:hypothetical protein
MTEGIKNVIAQLEQQKAAIERALAALREVEGPAEPVSAPAATRPASARAKRESRLTLEGRRRLSEAMKRRWGAKRTAAQARKRGRKAA